MTTFLDALRRHLPSGPDASENESIAHAILDTARAVVVVLGRDRRLRYANPHFEALSGHPLAGLTGRDWLEVCTSHAPAETREHWHDALEGSTQGVVCAIQSADGTPRWFQWVTRKVDGEPEESSIVLLIGHDVTERHRMMLELERLNASLAGEIDEHSQVLEAVFQASNVCLAYLDANFDFVQVNRAYAATDGKTPGDFPGLNHFDLYPDDDNLAIFTRVRDTGVAHFAYAKPFEYEHAPERGVTHWDWTLSPAQTRDGRVTGLVLALTDVTTRIMAMEELRRSKQRIRKELEEKEVLLREVHHRVKNNLQIVSSLLYLQSERATDPAAAHILAESRARVQAIALVHELLYSSGELGRIDLQAYVSGLAAGAREAYTTPGLDIEIRVDSTAPPVELADAVPCGLIVSELLANAMKHAFPGRSEGTIRVQAASIPSGETCIEVSDDGIGMPHVEAAGDGLGLTLVRRLADQLGGTLSVEVEGGSRFVLVFTPSGSRPDS